MNRLCLAMIPTVLSLASCRESVGGTACVDRASVEALVREIGEATTRVGRYAVCGATTTPMEPNSLSEIVMLMEGAKNGKDLWMLIAANKIGSSPWHAPQSFDRPSFGARTLDHPPSGADIEQFSRQAPWVAGSLSVASDCMARLASEMTCR